MSFSCLVATTVVSATATIATTTTTAVTVATAPTAVVSTVTVTVIVAVSVLNEQFQHTIKLLHFYTTKLGSLKSTLSYSLYCNFKLRNR